MCMIDDGGDRYRYSQTKQPLARKEHVCGECGRQIAAGEHYEAFRGLLADFGWRTEQTCVHCVAAREWLTVNCGGFVFQGVQQDLEEHFESTAGSLWLGRAIIGMKRKWIGLSPLGQPPRIAREA